jgi:hypothetical protein
MFFNTCSFFLFALSISNTHSDGTIGKTFYSDSPVACISCCSPALQLFLGSILISILALTACDRSLWILACVFTGMLSLLVEFRESLVPPWKVVVAGPKPG